MVDGVQLDKGVHVISDRSISPGGLGIMRSHEIKRYALSSRPKLQAGDFVILSEQDFFAFKFWRQMRMMWSRF